MSNAFNIESLHPCFDSSSSKLAWATADGRVRIFYASGQSQVKDITNDLNGGSIEDANVTNHLYSSLAWGHQVRGVPLWRRCWKTCMTT